MPPTSKPRSELSPRQESILEASLQRFGHYGFRRTSMDDIAKEARISRTALYQHFASKEDIFRALAKHLYEQALARANAAAASERSVAERLYAVLDAKMGFFYEMLNASAHGAEILDDNDRLCGDFTVAAGNEYLAVLARVVHDGERDGTLNPTAVGLSTDEAAEFFLRCAEGLTGKPGAKPTPDAYRAHLRRLVAALVAGFGAKRKATRRRKRS